MASVNRVTLIGNLGADPELRYTQSQLPVVSLNLATKDVRTDREGQKQETTEWHRVVVFGRQAENCSKYLKKGRQVYVEGRLTTRSWDDKNGVKRYTTEIIANTVQFLGSNREQGATAYEAPADNDSHSYSPSSSPSAAASEFSGLGAVDAGGMDEIPF